MKTEKPNERALSILKAVVEKYIREGQPVGSKALAEQTSIGLSSASIRNIMADLEEAGYLHSPHTSAGRVPTAEGYRLFVNALLTIQPLEEQQLTRLRSKLNANSEPSTLMETASNLISNITKLAGIVTVPRREQVTLRHVEFLQLSQNRVLAVLVFNDREIQNRIISTDRSYSASDLQQAGNFITQMYAGKSLTQVRLDLVNAIRTERDRMREILHATMDIAEKAFQEESNEQCIIAGETNLISLAEEAGIDRLRSLFEALTQKRDILHLLDGCLNNEGVQIFIGKESGFDVLDECSIVTAPYSAEGKVVGVLGVIGPTRMAYDRVISAVDVTAKLLSAALSE